MTQLRAVKDAKNVKNVKKVLGTFFTFFTLFTLFTLFTFPKALLAEEPAVSTVGPVILQTSGNQLIIKIITSKPGLRFETSRRLRPLRLIVEFSEVKLKGDPAIVPVGQAGVKRVLTEMSKDKTALVTVELTDWPKEYNVEETPSAILLQIQSDQPLKPIESPAVTKVEPPVDKPAAKSTVPAPVKPEPKPPVTAKAEPIKPAPVKASEPKSTLESTPSPAIEEEPEIKIIKVDPTRSVPPEAPKKSNDSTRASNGANGNDIPEPVKDASTQKPLKRRDLDQPVDLHLQNADLLATLINIADELGYNLVPSKSVTGTVTIRLSQVPLRKALEHVLNQAGLTYVIEDNVIRVATAGELQVEEDQGRLQTQVFALSYAPGSSMASSVKTVMSSRGKIQIDTRNNTLIITDTTLKLKDAENMIRQLDTRTRQVEIEAAVIAFRRGKSKEIGIRWNASQGSITGTTPTGVAPVDAALSSAPPTSAGSGFGSIAIGTIRSGTTIGALLQVLERDDDAEILARPHITTLDNKMAKINITTDFPYTSAFNQQTGIATFATVSTGIIMEVTPQISVDGYVTLKVKPSVSSIISAGPPPVVDKREAETEVLVKNGATLVIGGLLREDEVVTTTKIPLLSDIPVIGAIFKSTSSSKVKNELTILITPKIIIND